MKRLILQAPRHLRWEECDPPVPGPGEAVIAVRALGLCGSDLGAYEGRNAFQLYPCVPGHELGGVVVAAGAGVTGVQVGDHVAVEPLISCGRCRPCRQGRYNCCQNLEVLGVHRDGGMVEQMALPASLLHVATPELTFEQLALCEPLTVGLQAVRRARVAAGEWVVVLGAGTIGLAAMQMARSRGAHVISVDLMPARLEVARQLGADVVLDATRDLNQALADLTGDGPDVIIEAVGKAETIRRTLDLVAYAGRIVIVGHASEPVPLPMHTVLRKEVDLLGSRNSCHAFPEVMDLVRRGLVDLTAAVSHRLPFEDAIEAFHLCQARSEPVTKVVLHLGS